MRQIASKIILAICAAACAFCGWNIYGYYYERNNVDSSIKDMETEIQTSSNESPVSYQELKQRNSDYKGWIWFDSKLISLPIMQTSENDYYLKRNIDKEESLGGTPFIDAANLLSDQNITIYGHTVFDDSSNLAFTPLRQLLDQNTYDQNKRFYIDWESGVKTYQIFAVCDIDVDDDSWGFTQNDFQSDSSFYDFVRNAKQRSSISADVDVAATDSLVTLQTCTELHSTKRLVIVAKELK